MKKIFVIANPFSGKGNNDEILPDIIKILSQKYECILHKTTCQGDAKNAAKNIPDDIDVVVCVGGDGTMSEVAAGISELKKSIPIGYIPTGTTNDFAKSLGIPLADYKSAAKKILEGSPMPLDLGYATARKFVYVASFGIFTRCSYSISQHVKNVFGHSSYIITSLKDLFPIKSYKIKIKTQNKEYDEKFIFASVSNTYSLGGVFNFSKNLVDLNDGLFEVLLVKECRTIFSLISCFNAVIRHNYNHKNILFFKTDSIEFTSEKPLEWSLDGEHYTGKKTEIINVSPKKISVIV